MTMPLALAKSSYGLIAAIIAGWLLAGYAIWWIGDRINRRRSKDQAVKAGIPGEAADRVEDEADEELSRGAIADGWARRLMVKLDRAGLELKPSEYVGISSAVSILLAVIFALWLKKLPGMQFIGLLAGILASWAYLENRCAKRVVAFNNQLPDALSLIASAMRSGAGFERAAAMVRDEMPKPISDEFRVVLADMRVGLSLDDSLKRMVDKMCSYDLELVTVAVTINRQVGGNLSMVLDNISSMIRQRVRLEREVSALTAEGRMSGVILSLLPFLLTGVLFYMSPDYASVLFTNTVGQILVGCAITLQIVGILIIRSILKTDF
ncbi:MAG: type II secretion system F family protein [Armatimonadetes bacterium]|nr:type II secretion system F family protein [Armatimonadota bacterium]